MDSTLTIASMQSLDHQMGKQLEKFGHCPIATPDAFCRILGEEFGEVCREINQGSREHLTIDQIGRLKHEAIHCAAVCMAFVQNQLHDGEAK
jgi:hypothetical protein